MLAILPGVTALLVAASFLAAASAGATGHDASCEERCDGKAQLVLEACVEADGTEETCREAAAQARQSCLDERCTGDGEHDGDGCDEDGDGTDDACAARCERRWHETKHACVDTGESYEVCRLLADDVKRECLEEECAVPHASCEETCQADAEAGFRTCVAAGGEEDGCAADAEAARTACVAERCSDPASQDCPARCAARAAQKEVACVADGEAPERCAARAGELARHCVAEHCEDAEAEPETCEARCDDHAADDFRRCVAAGGIESDCRQAAEQRFAGCVALHCTGDDACDARCARKAEKAARRCTRRGGDTAECEALAAEVQAACENRHCLPPPPETCSAACEAAGARAESLCLANGHPAEECTALARGVEEACVEACGAAPPATCEEQCEAEATETHETARAAGASEPRAARRARRVLRTCYAPCTGD